ncbi:TraB/GumN family protein [Sphingobium tyrosinilyticum]|uniref:TraB/GumN family protein n=1 Tax=Sphingobium tyrosinilyticum TaxID=2715436 RepID=A0ABV9F2E0_9SPHN
MSLLRWLGLCALLLVAACGRDGPAPAEGRGPALWRVQGHGLDGWLFGTVHVLPKGVAWRTEKVRAAIDGSDRLVLESAEIQDRARTMALFEKMGRSPGLPPLEARVPVNERDELQRIAGEGGTSTQLLSGYESWAAAMLLSAAAQQSLHVSGDEGVEPALIKDFREEDKPIGGLETVARQFGAFDTLPEAAQRRLLAQTVEEARRMKALYERIMRAWLEGDMAAIAREDEAGEKPDPVVEQAVLIARNRDWSDVVGKLRGRPFIAVGTGHLTGRDNLIQLLEAKGYKVTRVQ